MDWNVIGATIASVIAAVAYSTFFYYFFFRRLYPVRRKRFQQAKERFFDELTRRSSLGVLRTIDDVEQIHRTVANEVESYRFRSTPADVLLMSYLSVVTAATKEVGEEAAKQRYEFVQKLIDAKRAREPFSNLPGTERIVAHRVQEAIESGQKNAALSHLQELSTALGARLEQANARATRNMIISIAAILVSLTAIPVTIILS